MGHTTKPASRAPDGSRLRSVHVEVEDAAVDEEFGGDVGREDLG